MVRGRVRVKVQVSFTMGINDDSSDSRSVSDELAPPNTSTCPEIQSVKVYTAATVPCHTMAFRAKPPSIFS